MGGSSTRILIMTKHWRTGVGVAALAGLGLWAAAGVQAQPAAGAAKGAVAKLKPTANNSASGEVTFTQEGDGVRVSGSFSGVAFKPGDTKHGFHIHEKGDCSAPDGSSAGGHFNPGAKPHGAPDAADRHAGDLGNFEVDAYNNGRINYLDKTISLSGPNSIIGKGVIVHEKADDFKTQPTGNAGARLACGVIEAK
jgi:Cu-Zn family superoxide dismutase